MAANGAELTQLLEIEWFRWLAPQNSRNVLRALPALPLGELPGGRRGLSIPRVDNQRAIANCPNIARAPQPHIRLRHQPSLLFWAPQPFDHWRGRASDCAD